MNLRSDWTKAPIWFQWALHEVGVHEINNNSGPKITEYRALAHAGHDHDPWCAIFANAALETNGILGTRSASSQSFRSNENFVQLDGPSLGAIAVFWRNSRDSGIGHVAFYRGETLDRVYTLGGNQADMVNIEPMAKHGTHFGLYGYWWPKSVALPNIQVIPIRSGQPLQQVSVT